MTVIWRKMAALVAAVLLLTLCGCSRNQREEHHTIVAPEFVPLTTIREDQPNIYLIVKNLDSNYWQVIIDAVRDTGYDLNCNVFYSGTYSEVDWTEQSKLLDEARDSGADAVIISPDDSVNLAGKISEIYRCGIPVILVDTIANTEDFSICYMTDNYMAGQQAADEMIRSLFENGYGDADKVLIGIQVGSTSSQTINERLAGFYQAWYDSAPDSWEICNEILCNDGEIGIAEDCAEELFDKYDLTGVFAPNNGSTVGFARVIEERELHDMVLVGFDYSDEVRQLVESDEYIASTLLQRQYDMGSLALESALEFIDGEETELKFVDTGVIVVNSSDLNSPEVCDAIARN